MDAPLLIDLITNNKTKAEFVELKPHHNHLQQIRIMRNKWAHQEDIDDYALLAFLRACEEVVTAIVTVDTQPSYEQIRALRLCFTMLLGEKACAELTQIDHLGHPMLVYPLLLPAFEE